MKNQVKLNDISKEYSYEDFELTDSINQSQQSLSLSENEILEQMEHNRIVLANRLQKSKNLNVECYNCNEVQKIPMNSTNFQCTKCTKLNQITEVQYQLKIGRKIDPDVISQKVDPDDFSRFDNVSCSFCS